MKKTSDFISLTETSGEKKQTHKHCRHVLLLFFQLRAQSPSLSSSASLFLSMLAYLATFNEFCPYALSSCRDAPSSIPCRAVKCPSMYRQPLAVSLRDGSGCHSSAGTGPPVCLGEWRAGRPLRLKPCDSGEVTQLRRAAQAPASLLED